MSALTVTVPTARLAEDLGEIEGVEIVVWPMDAACERAQVDLVVLPYLTQGSALPLLATTTTRLVQSQSIGYENVADRLPGGVSYANAAGVHEASTAELALALALAAQRRLPDFVRAQQRGSWEFGFTGSLADRRVLVLGHGGVGKAVVARLVPFETEVTVVASRARDEDGIRVHGIDELPALLPSAEVVILTLPANDATRHLVDDAFLAALPDGALVVNVGRGPLVDTDALVDHVRRGRIRAALDVTDPEPLPRDHPLWTLDGVIVTPHVGGASAAMRPRIAGLIRRQIERLRSGDEPLNIVLRT